MRKQISIQNAVTVAAVAVAAVAVLRPGGSALEGTASAQEFKQNAAPPALFSTNSQNDMIIRELHDLNARMEKLQKKLDKGLKVHVVDLPAVKISEMPEVRIANSGDKSK